ncbi:protein RESISTANCE TO PHYTOPHTHORA 1, chloroplastic isoform X1 [Vitis riparia]|uniref:protein RESISTANCE TO PHYTOPHTHORA 1, chloroplastic isoform X1 n=1 Tax=Vitis riparia TaxID=96939 RepID=UPI00155A4829|nr:protein RESISTANCE TO PHYTOPHTHORA 1, chloroplastic isoform X1 [Vitis riparia]
MNTIIPTSFCHCPISKLGTTFSTPRYTQFRTKTIRIQANSNEVDTQTVEERTEEESQNNGASNISTPSSTAPALDKDLKKVVQKTAATFAPRASTATKNPAVPGTVLYTVFEVQGYLSMLLGGALSFNFLFPSNEPDIWRLMGMWSIWMFTIPSLRARDCSKNEKEALNYLFLIIPLLNIIIPFFWKSFAVVWSADTVAFVGMYAWKGGYKRRTRQQTSVAFLLLDQLGHCFQI